MTYVFINNYIWHNYVTQQLTINCLQALVYIEKLRVMLDAIKRFDIDIENVAVGKYEHHTMRWLTLKP